MSELAGKMVKLGALYAAIDRVRAALDGCPPGGRKDLVLQLQILQRQVESLRRTLPKPRLVWSR